MAKEVTRSIKGTVQTQLWARAAGRCQFNNCNRPLYKSPVTEEQGNISEIAHIWSYSEEGPRGWGPFKSKRDKLNELPNLMLLCHDCHKIIDADKQGKVYSAKLLCKWKEEHEKRIAITTGIDPSKKSHVVLFGANIGEQKSLLQPEHAKEALFPDCYPADERPIHLSMSWEGKDDKPDYWQVERNNLMQSFDRKIVPIIEQDAQPHFSIFALAPMPLMILLGAMFTDKTPVRVFQLHREPEQTWKWVEEHPEGFKFLVKPPDVMAGKPALIISLSAIISHDRVAGIVGQDCSIWELTIEEPHNDFLKTETQLSMFRETARKLMVDIAAKYRNSEPLSIFPAMPVACSVELGRIRMPKADMAWIIYDHNNKHERFVEALTIGG